MDKEGLIKVGGRLENTTLSNREKYPKILSSAQQITTNLIRDDHKKTLRGSLKSTFAYLLEAILNSRLLCPIIESPENYMALTPAHFLMGEPIVSS